MTKTKRIALITPGGDAPGMNAAIRAVVRASLDEKIEVLGVRRGYAGLLENDIFPMHARSVSGIIHHGGTILKSSRCSEIKKDSAIRSAAAILKARSVGALVVVGGDGSIRAAQRIAVASRGDVGAVCLPASIDNDIFGTDETIGYDTALNTAVDAVDKIRDTAVSFDRIFIVEVMGREHGYLALDTALAAGAEFVVVPEIKTPVKRVAAEVKTEKARGKTSVIVIFAEGAGNVRDFASELSRLSGYEVRVSSLGYIQRGGAPSGRTRILAAKFGARAVRLAASGRLNRLIALKDGKICDLPLSKNVAREKTVDRRLYKLVGSLGR